MFVLQTHLCFANCCKVSSALLTLSSIYFPADSPYTALTLQPQILRKTIQILNPYMGKQKSQKTRIKSSVPQFQRVCGRAGLL
jgi:hypothetical protein